MTSINRQSSQFSAKTQNFTGSKTLNVKLLRFLFSWLVCIKRSLLWETVSSHRAAGAKVPLVRTLCYRFVELPHSSKFSCDSGWAVCPRGALYGKSHWPLIQRWKWRNQGQDGGPGGEKYGSWRDMNTDIHCSRGRRVRGNQLTLKSSTRHCASTYIQFTSLLNM